MLEKKKDEKKAGMRDSRMAAMKALTWVDRLAGLSAVEMDTL